jgi:hypothetical protein
MNSEIDARHILSAIRVPTLIIVSVTMRCRSKPAVISPNRYPMSALCPRGELVPLMID